jgi:hypothetical protein
MKQNRRACLARARVTGLIRSLARLVAVPRERFPGAYCIGWHLQRGWHRPHRPLDRVTDGYPSAKPGQAIEAGRVPFAISHACAKPRAVAVDVCHF